MIRCQPDDVSVDPGPDESVMDALVRSGVRIAHACGGKAACSTCRVCVLDGLDACGPRTDAEEKMAARLKFPGTIRLACQTHAAGDVEVRRLVLDDSDLSLASVLNETATVGHEQDVAVLFADIAGFTAIAEVLPAYDIVHLLNRYYSAAGEAVGAFGGRIVNYMGDGFMALFGLGGSADAVPRAVQAGLAVLDAAARVDAYFFEIYGSRLTVRVGVHCGPAVVGHIGAAGERQETAIGDTINLASRIEAANKQTGTRLLVSDDVRRRADAGLQCGETFTVTVRGKSEPVVLHEVVGYDA